MAAHLTCYNSDVLPNSFPAPKPSAREYSNFMASEYQASSVMNSVYPKPVVEITGSHEYDYLEDDIPILSKPVPTVTELTRRTTVVNDPQLCITPEKKSPAVESLRYHSKVPVSRSLQMDPELCLTPEPSPYCASTIFSHTDSQSDLRNVEEFQNSGRSVRFDQNVEVHQLSPVNSTLGSSPTSTNSFMDSAPSVYRSNYLPPQISLTENNLPDINSGTSDTGRININIAKANLHNSSAVKNAPIRQDPTKSKLHLSSDMRKINNYSNSLSSNSFSSTDGSGLDSLSSHSSVEPDSMEAIDIIASDLRPEISSRFTKGRSVMVSSNEVVESILARTEFSSTLRVRKEISNVQDSELDLINAVKSKLKTSEKTKVKVNEKAYSRVNQENFKFQELPGIEVRQEDAILIAEENITAKAKPPVKSRNKPENDIHKVPDIMDFFDRKLQLETASFSLPGLPQTENNPRTAEASRTFDVYRHIRTWEDW